MASPAPLEVVELAQIIELLSSHQAVIACGGGGVPVVREGSALAGSEAVIDKDLIAALVGANVGATSLLLLTGVERVAIDFGKPTQRSIDQMTIAEARAYMADGQFPAGSMGPKVEAAMTFIEGGGQTAIIASLEQSAAAIGGQAGTRIVA